MALRKLDISESTNVSSAEYDEERGELHVTFYSGESGFYTGATPRDANELEQAESPGRYLHRSLRLRCPWVRR